jgi:hypothetical protein
VAVRLLRISSVETCFFKLEVCNDVSELDGDVCFLELEVGNNASEFDDDVHLLTW